VILVITEPTRGISWWQHYVGEWWGKFTPATNLYPLTHPHPRPMLIFKEDD